MGVYIKGMEMPKEGSWTTVRIYPDGTCAVPNWQGDCTLIKGTKAVPVPPHGRLIDKDVMCNECRRIAEEYDGIYPDCTYCHAHLASTVVPAEEGET